MRAGREEEIERQGKDKRERKMKGTCRLAGWLAEAEYERKSDEGKRDSWSSV